MSCCRSNSFGQSALPVVTFLFAIVATFTGLGLSGGVAAAESKKTRPNSKEHPGIDPRVVEPGAKEVEELDPANFDRSENIDHPYWPLKPGMQWVYDGYTEENGKRTPHRIEFIVTDMIKVIGEVRCRVIFDSDYSNGKLIEKELTFFARDKFGNVWHLGQYREHHEDEFVGGRIWTLGNPEGAKAEIMMPADLKPGTPSYSEGYAPPPFYWTDRGRVSKIGQKMKVPFGSFDDVVVIDEFDSEKTGAFQLKYYARGVGNIAVGYKGKVDSKEELKLVKSKQLSPKELDEVRAKALELEKRGSMYPQPPMEHIPLTQ
jgi:hypothetical protein